jgi:ferredoxin
MATRVEAKLLTLSFSEVIIESYLRDCSQGLEKFRETKWRCEMRRNQLRCRNYWDGHEKGHQFVAPGQTDSEQNTALLVGGFLCTWEPERVMKAIYAEICRQRSEEIAIIFPKVAESSGVRYVRSNRTCFTCLSECPVYILPCEHVQHTICTTCATRFNHDIGRSQATLCLQRCPLGCNFREGRPWHSRIKPPTAGVRVLSLDG